MFEFVDTILNMIVVGLAVWIMAVALKVMEDKYGTLIAILIYIAIMSALTLLVMFLA